MVEHNMGNVGNVGIGNAGMVTHEQFGKHVKTREHMYKSFVQNGFFLPVNMKNSFVSMKMLKEMYTGKCHCPRYAEIKFLPCGDPPSAEFLRDEMVRNIEENGAYTSPE